MQVRKALHELDLGNSVAEFDLSLENYFVETEAFRSLTRDRTDVIAGDKGTGKSALYKILSTRYTGIPELAAVEVLSAFNASGTPVFQRLTETDVLDEWEYIGVRVEVGYHQAARPGEVDLLLPLPDPRHLLPLPGRLDVASRESATLAERLIAESVPNQRVDRGQLTLHADRGSSMASTPVAFLLADLGVTKSHSRPHCSNDNPYSEAQFKTLKYRPDFPNRFGCIEDARVFCDRFFSWYGHDHRHSGIGLHTPADVHDGRAGTIHEARGQVLDAAHTAHPERFVRKPPSRRDSPQRYGSTSPTTRRNRLSNRLKNVSQKG